MRHSPFASPSKALTFTAVVVLGGLVISETAGDVTEADGEEHVEVVSVEPAPTSTIAAFTTAGDTASWNSDGVDNDGPVIEIATYTPPSRTRSAAPAEGEVAFTGRRRIPNFEPRIVK